jgi:hypothetical protein
MVEEVCSFYVASVNDCMNAYCYYELYSNKTCPVKEKFMAETGAVDPALRARLTAEALAAQRSQLQVRRFGDNAKY